MGISTDAILAYGVSFDSNSDEEEEYDEDSESDDEEEEEEIKLLKAFNPSILDQQPTVEFDKTPEVYALYSTWWDVKRQAVAALPVEWVTHCHHEFPMKILTIRVRGFRTYAEEKADPQVRAHQSASRGLPIPLGQTITANPEWRGILEDACKKLNLKFSEPQWYLASYWG